MSSEASECVEAIRELARRGGLASLDADSVLLGSTVPEMGIRWRGGIRQEPDGRLLVVESVEGLPGPVSQRVNQLLGTAYLGFFDAATDGLPLTDVGLIERWFGESVPANYPEGGPEFLRFAVTYWTLKVLIRQEEADQPLAWHLAKRLDDLIWPLFFPFDGPLIADPEQREADQRRFLAAFAPRIAVDPFIAGNSILIRDRIRHRR